MDVVSYLLIGVVIGAIAGWGFASARRGKSGSADVSLAAAQASLSAVSQQLEQAQREIQTRNEREAESLAEENRILQQLAPVQKQVEQMQGKLEDLERERLSQFTAIKEQLTLSAEQNRKLTENTTVLAGALNNKQARGQWGELTLRRLLENSGMRAHVDFFEQQTGTNDDGKTIRPDCIISYPDSKFIAVDSKVPFDDYQRATAISEVASPEDEKKRRELLKSHVDAVKKHINDISGKNYYTGLKSSPEFTVMFMPSEGMLAATLDTDPTILSYGFSKQIAIVSPVSIYSVLRTIEYGWRQSAQEETIKEVIDLGVTLHKYVRVVAEHASKLGGYLQSAVGSYNSFLSSLERNLLSSTRKVNERSKGILDGGKPVPELSEVSESIDVFSKPELTADTD